MNKVLIILVVLLLAGGVWYMFTQNKTSGPTTVPDKKTETSVTAQTTPSASQVTGAMEEATKTIAVSGKPFEFTPKEITVKKGETVKIVFTNTQGFHDWTLEGYNVKTKQLQAGQSEAVTFVAEKAGTFAYYCGVGNHRDQGMKGSLIVE